MTSIQTVTLNVVQAGGLVETLEANRGHYDLVEISEKVFGGGEVEVDFLKLAETDYRTVGTRIITVDGKVTDASADVG